MLKNEVLKGFKVALGTYETYPGFNIIAIPIPEESNMPFLPSDVYMLHLTHDNHSLVLTLGKYINVEKDTFIKEQLPQSILDGIDKYIELTRTISFEEADNVSELRKMTGMSQREFGTFFGISLKNIQNWEQGVSNPPAYVLDMMKRLLKDADVKGMQINQEEDNRRKNCLENKSLEELFAAFERTKNNCLFYEEAEDKMNLLSEIGVLRGIAYSIESLSDSDEVFQMMSRDVKVREFLSYQKKMKSTSENWEEKFALAEKYYKENGNLSVQNDYEVDGVKLGKWLATQRTHHNTLRLDEDKTRALDAIGMVWDIEDEK